MGRGKCIISNDMYLCYFFILLLGEHLFTVLLYFVIEWNSIFLRSLWHLSTEVMICLLHPSGRVMKILVGCISDRMHLEPSLEYGDYL